MIRKLDPEAIGGAINDAMKLALIAMCLSVVFLSAWVARGAL